MFKHLSPRAIVATITSLAISLALVAVAPAQTPPLVTYVSGQGTDSGSCDNKSAPCRTFQYAVDHTGFFGEVQALDPADYGPVTISHPLSITGVDGAGILLGEAGSTKAAIDIEAGPLNGPVHLTGLTLDGFWRGVIQPVTTGVLVNAPGIVTITRCTVRNFLATAIDIRGANTSFLIADTLVSDNDTGISIAPRANSTAAGILDHVWVHRNRTEGLDVSPQGGQAHVTAVEITVTENRRYGIGVEGNVDLTLAHSTITGNEGVGISIVAPITGVMSFGDNYIGANGQDVSGGTLTHVGAQ